MQIKASKAIRLYVELSETEAKALMEDIEGMIEDDEASEVMYAIMLQLRSEVG